jgi:hypothetical protein
MSKTTENYDGFDDWSKTILGQTSATDCSVNPFLRHEKKIEAKSGVPLFISLM